MLYLSFEQSTCHLEIHDPSAPCNNKRIDKCIMRRCSFDQILKNSAGTSYRMPLLHTKQSQVKAYHSIQTSDSRNILMKIYKLSLPTKEKPPITPPAQRKRHFIQPKLRELDIMSFIQLIVYALLGESITTLGSRQVFDERFSQQPFFLLSTVLAFLPNTEMECVV